MEHTSENRWTHAICDEDYVQRYGNRTPHRVRNITIDGPDDEVAFVSDPCCFCGKPTHGIYVRESFQIVHGEAT